MVKTFASLSHKKIIYLIARLCKYTVSTAPITGLLRITKSIFQLYPNKTKQKFHSPPPPPERRHSGWKSDAASHLCSWCTAARNCLSAKHERRYLDCNILHSGCDKNRCVKCRMAIYVATLILGQWCMMGNNDIKIEHFERRIHDWTHTMQGWWW